MKPSTPSLFDCARLLLALAFGASVFVAHAAEPLEEADQSAREWVKLRVETTRLDAAWRTERELAESTLTALKERATLAEEKRDLARARTAREREELDGLRGKNQDTAADLKAGEARVQALAEKLIALRPQLPPRLSSALDMSYRSLATADRPFGERLQLAMNVLNRCNQFNGLVSTGEDVVTVEGEAAPKSLQTMYWGLSHGYAIDRTTRRAWFGRPRDGAWRWEAKPAAYDAIVQLIAIATDKSDPDFVSVPATVAHAVATPTAP